METASRSRAWSARATWRAPSSPRRGALLACCVMAALTAPAAQAEEPFEYSWLSYNVGTSDYPGNAAPTERDVSALAVADFDGDGTLDVAVSTSEETVPGDGQTGFAILFNDGSGRLGSAVHTTVSNQSCYDIAAGDFDNDGDPDVAVSIANIWWEGQMVRLYLNDGTGAFSSFVTRNVADGPIGLAAADFDSDGNLDLAVASYNIDLPNGVVSVLRGNGAGGLSAPTAYPVTRRPFRLEAGDLDGDGKADLAVAHEMQAVSILLNQGNGTFGTPEVHDALYPMQGGMYYPCVTLADTDRDGDLDIFYANTRSHQPAASVPNIVHLRNVGGTFQRVADIPLTGNSAGPTDLAAGDLNGDSWPDLIGLNYSGRSGDGPRVVLNDGAGGFLPATAYPAGQATFSVALADLDADGDADLLTGDRYSMAVTVHENPGTGIFPLPHRFETGYLNTMSDHGDVDGDGDLDLFTSTEMVGWPGALLRNSGDGTFLAPEFYTHSSDYGRGVARAKLRDLDNDGDLDLLYNDAHTDYQNGYNFYTAKNDGAGNFGPIIEWVIGTCGTGDVDAFDLDGDGDLDVINCEELACAGGESANRLFISLNHGDGTFAPAYLVQISTGPHALIGGDYNHDGNVDLVTTHWMPYGLRDFINVHIGNGDGTFQEEVVYQTGQGPRFIVQDDFDGDGHVDLATANSGADNYGRETLTVWFGNGAGGFSGRTDYYAPYSPDLQGVCGLAAGDVDADGDIDLMMTTVANGVALYTNDGIGSFTFGHRLGAFWNPWSPRHADFSGDGIADLAILTDREAIGNEGALILLAGTSAGPSDVPPPLDEIARVSAMSAVSPNPFRTFAQFDVRVPATEHVEIAIYDLAGRTVQAVHSGRLEADVRHTFAVEAADLPAGVYFLRARGGSFEETRKIVLAR